MATLNVEDCKQGQRVILTNPDEDYTISSRNPCFDSEWSCEGMIVAVRKDFVDVKWDNGYSNCYKDGELSPVNNYIDIWSDL